jgi:hypothetical protein
MAYHLQLHGLEVEAPVEEEDLGPPLTAGEIQVMVHHKVSLGHLKPINRAEVETI